MAAVDSILLSVVAAVFLAAAMDAVDRVAGMLVVVELFRLRLVKEGKNPSFLGVDVPMRKGVRSLVFSFCMCTTDRSAG